MCTLCYSAGHPLRVADLLPQGPTAMSVIQNLCYSTTWRMGASKAVCLINLGAKLLVIITNFCTWWAVVLWAFQAASAKPPKRCHCARCAGFLPSWVLGHQLLINFIWCHASLPPPYKQWKRLWWTTVTILLFKPIAIGKFCLGSILSKLGYRQPDVTIANSLK